MKIDSKDFRVRPEGLEGLLRSIRRRGQAIGAKANPGQERNQGDTVKEVAVAKIARLTEDGAAHALRQCFG